MKRHHKERLLIALACLAGFTVVLLVERMNHGAVQSVASNTAVADIQLATVTGTTSGAVWTNAPWEWSARPAKRFTVEQALTRRVSTSLQMIPPRPGQFDLIDFRHQPSVTVDFGR